MELTEAIALFDKSAERTKPNAQTEAWIVIRAALTASGAAPEGWQPIETAPKDGTAIIGGNPKWLRCAIFEWDDEFNNWWTDDTEANGTVPTHWQPMPASPATPNPGAQHGQEGR